MLQSKSNPFLFVMLIFIAFVAINPACAQTKINVDSLVHFCDNYTAADTIKLKALIKVSEAYQSKNQLKGIAYGEKAIQLATQLNNPNLLADAYQATGKNMVRNSRYTDALVMYGKALEIQKNANNQAAIGRIYGEMGVLYRRNGDISNAVKMYELCMPLLEKNNQQKEIAVAYNNMGTVYMNTSDYLLAINFLQKAISVNEGIGELELLAVNLNNMGYLQILLSDYNAALISLNKAVEINQKLDNKMWVAMHNDNIGLAYLGLRQYDKALEILHKALAINEEIGNNTSVSVNLNNIGKVQIALGKYSEASIALFRSLEISSKASDRYDQGLAYCQLGTAYEQSTVALKDGANRSERLKRAIFYYQNALDISAITKTIETQSASWQGLSKVYKEQGLYSKAFDAFEKHVTLKDSIGGAEIKKQVAVKEIKYEYDKKETKFKYEQQLTAGELEKQQILTLQQEQTLTLKEQSLALINKDLLLSNKEKDLAYLAFLKEQAEKQEKTQELSLSEEREKGAVLDLSLKNLELSAQQKQNLYWGLLAAVLFGGLGISLYFYSLLKKKNTIITQQNELNEHTIAILSHDIKEPLLGVKLMLKKLNKDDPFVEQASKSLEGQINAVNGILTNLLKMKKLSLVKKDKNVKANAQSVVQNVVTELSVAIQTKALTIQNDLADDVTLPIAPEKLQIIIHNLLSNAVKYSFPNQTIRIFKEGKGISIQDFGIGLSPEQRTKLMREVTASQRGTNEEKGNGLGLFLVGAMLHGEQLKVVFDSPEVGGTIAKVL